jgi:asparagine synthase (glutamine-hydrolysing)
MCGIVGLWCRTSVASEAVVERMRDSLAYRGPDDAGLWCEGPVGFGHRRLSIVDLSPLGHQPMEGADRRYVICFNGEVFNFAALRQELEALGHRFAGHSDTEVMLAAFSAWGVREAVGRFIGMFAFAVWDRQAQALHLVRDRLGIKPLYVGRTQAGDLLFASELKALAAHPAFSRRTSVDAAAQFLRHGYVPAPLSIYQDAVKLEPGHLLTLSSPDGQWNAATPYWSLEEVARRGAEAPFAGGAEEALAELEHLVRDAVRLRMIADVPLGAFLSGGIDSSLVVAMMQSLSTRPVRTFTIGFTEARFDEAAFARGIARHLGTDHTELLVTPADALAVIPRLPEMFDEPFADATQIPTYLVSELARRHVTVSLSGDGGDELFGGYARYRRTRRAWRVLGWMPPSARRLLARGVRAGGYAGGGDLRRRLDKAADWLGASGPDAMYERLVVTTANLAAFMPSAAEDGGAIRQLVARSAALPLAARFMFADTRIYLPDDLLTKLDRASMAVSLEGRVPLLDHRIVEFAWRLPLGLRSDKWLLKRLLGRYVPEPLFDRPKMGFEIPLAEWLRGPLKAWAAELLTSGDSAGQGPFDRRAVADAWQRFAVGGGGDAHLIWSLVMFESWRRHWHAEA